MPTDKVINAAHWRAPCFLEEKLCRLGRRAHVQLAPIPTAIRPVHYSLSKFSFSQTRGKSWDQTEVV